MIIIMKQGYKHFIGCTKWALTAKPEAMGVARKQQQYKLVARL